MNCSEPPGPRAVKGTVQYEMRNSLVEKKGYFEKSPKATEQEHWQLFNRDLTDGLFRHTFIMLSKIRQYFPYHYLPLLEFSG